MHDVRLGRSLAQIIDPSWLDTKVVAGRILAKILAEIHADSSLSSNEMEELLENDDERFVFQNLLFQETDHETQKEILELANHCIAVLFSKYSRRSEKKLLNNLQESNSSTISMTAIRTQLKELRTSRQSPPKILETEI